MIVDFIKNIFATGELTVEREITPFTDTDQEITVEILKHYFDLYKVRFPNPHTIQFQEQAGFWAASYLYRLCQALVLRELSEEEVQEMLPLYNTATISTDEVLTVDLLFQSIPRLFDISKMLSPQDILITEIKKLAKQWPLSLLEISDEQNIEYIKNNDTLLAIYSNRIIEKKQHKAIISSEIKAKVLEQLGDYQSHFWNDLKETIDDTH